MYDEVQKKVDDYESCKTMEAIHLAMIDTSYIRKRSGMFDARKHPKLPDLLYFGKPSDISESNSAEMPEPEFYRKGSGMHERAFVQKRMHLPMKTGASSTMLPTHDGAGYIPMQSDDSLAYDDYPQMIATYDDVMESDETGFQGMPAPVATLRNSPTYVSMGKEKKDVAESSAGVDSLARKRYNVDRLKKWLAHGPYRNYMNSYYIRWNLLWPLTKENED